MHLVFQNGRESLDSMKRSRRSGPGLTAIWRCWTTGIGCSTKTKDCQRASEFHFGKPHRACAFSSRWVSCTALK
ncbi:hypothetical protein DP49_4275 [Burkholderia pseudomallei]|nr:hypothetical protein DP49_4275 [Burkholderia pseudomallei]